MSAHRINWATLPEKVRAHLEHAFGGRVIDVHTPTGGFGHQLAVVLTLNDGNQVFVKGAPDDDRLTVTNLAEAAVLDILPSTAPAPGLIAVERIAGWTIVVIEHLDGEHPNLRPDSPDLTTVLKLLETLATDPADKNYKDAVRTTAAEKIRFHGWAFLNQDDLSPWAAGRLDQLQRLEQAWPSYAHGDCIIHGDLRVDNMIRDQHRGPVFVDWAHATVGPAWVDLAALGPQLILEGHQAESVAELLADHPLTAENPDGVDSLLAALTGHWERSLRQPEPTRAPGLREYQRRAAAAGCALLAARLA